ncbi:uncharacterized protein LOC110379243 isoform X1 [Helicoverpa armigera]|uniref:uncharacterized protein LOC110379243 isoform X1 n=1 Tax=Helicoverpa armigera TaxID=29058 RepID=UPI003082750C
MKVYDEIDLNKYCSDDKLCSQTESGGPHIICHYLDIEPKACMNFRAYDLTKKHVTNILNRFNVLRAKAANGEALGKDGVFLPRAYGLMRVFWDSELAGIAKLITSTCIKAHQYDCVATTKFPNPVMAYLHQNITSQPSDPEQLIESLMQVWLDAKDEVSPAMLEKCPSFKSGIARRHIKMLMNNLTHVGCAFGVYYAVKHTKAAHLTCYLSYWTPEGEPVYATEAPDPGSGYSEECGCPPNYKESEDCLCVPGSRTPDRNAKESISSEFNRIWSAPREAINSLLAEVSQSIEEATEIAETQKRTEGTATTRSRTRKLPSFTIEPKCGKTAINSTVIVLPLFKLVDVDLHGKTVDFNGKIENLQGKTKDDKDSTRSLTSDNNDVYVERNAENMNDLFNSLNNNEDAVAPHIIGSELYPNVIKFKKQEEFVPTTKYSYNIPTTRYSYDIPMTKYSYNTATEKYSYNIPTTRYFYNTPTKKYSYTTATTRYSYDIPTTKHSYHIPTTRYSYHVPTAIINKKPLVKKSPIPTNGKSCPIRQNDPKKQKKQELMNLLDVLIEKGKNVTLGKDEIGKFEKQMRRIYEIGLRKKSPSSNNHNN